MDAVSIVQLASLVGIAVLLLIKLALNRLVVPVDMALSKEETRHETL